MVKFEVGIAVHVTRRRTIEAATPEAAVLRAMREIAGKNNRNGIQPGDVLYVTVDGNGVAYSRNGVDARWNS